MSRSSKFVTQGRLPAPHQTLQWPPAARGCSRAAAPAGCSSLHVAAAGGGKGKQGGRMSCQSVGLLRRLRTGCPPLAQARTAGCRPVRGVAVGRWYAGVRHAATDARSDSVCTGLHSIAGACAPGLEASSPPPRPAPTHTHYHHHHRQGGGDPPDRAFSALNISTMTRTLMLQEGRQRGGMGRGGGGAGRGGSEGRLRRGGVMAN